MELGLTRTRTLALCFTIILVLVFLGNVKGNEDSEALIAVKNSLVDPNNNVFQSWDSGADPCSWFHIQCNKDNRVSRIDLGNGNLSGILVPQIAQLSYLERLSLYNNNISGRIPDELGDLTNLDSLELYSNKFTGSIPETLGKLHKLQYLRLNNNNLTGEIPISLTTIKSLKILELSYNNLRGPIPVNGSFSKFTPQSFFPNKFNSTIGSSPSASNHTSGDGAVVAIAGGVAAGAAFLIGALCIAVVLWRRRQRKIRFFDIPAEECPEAQLGQLKKFSLSELQIATDNFSNKNILGRGGFGKVYKGRLTDGCLVAVKRLKDEANYAGEMQFQSELEIIGMAVHRNLLRLRGFCMTPTERMLVYPYMVNGSVASCLKERPKSRPPLSWSIRKKIAFGAAKGLAYLHDHCNPKIIHRDVKAANILLDEQFEAVVGDFGLAKLMDFKDTHVTTDVKGTIGHIAPEYLSNGRSSEKTDVFGYGVMLLELITGQRTFYLAQLADDNNAMLLEWVKRLVNEKKLDTLIDSDLEDSYVKEEVEQLIQVALLCTQGSPTERPKMSEVVRMLEADNGLVERWEEWQKMDMPCQEINHMYSPNIDSTYNLCPEELSGPR